MICITISWIVLDIATVKLDSSEENHDIVDLIRPPTSAADNVCPHPYVKIVTDTEKTEQLRNESKRPDAKLRPLICITSDLPIVSARFIIIGPPLIVV